MFLVLLFAVGAFFLFFYHPPTCFDGKQNGGEQGTDCGGACRKICPFQAAKANVLWARSFKVAPGVYNAVAYVENPNTGAAAYDAAYSFKAYDEENVLVFERSGTVTLPPKTVIAVFEPSVTTNERSPKRTFFEWHVDPRFDRTTKGLPELGVAEKVLSGETGRTPRLTARIVNPSLDEIRNIQVVATVFDTAGNAIAASRTIVDVLRKESSAEVTFTWPEAFSATVGRTDVVAMPPFASPR
jgi:hypothetical protein